MAAQLKDGTERDSTANKVARHVWLPVELDHELVDLFHKEKKKKPTLTYSQLLSQILKRGLSK